MSTNTKGVVLISVMMIMLILSAIGVSLSQNYFLALKRESYVNFENNALQYIGTIEVLSAEEMKKAVLKYASREINKNNIVKRTKILQNNYSDKMNADNLISIVY